MREAPDYVFVTKEPDDISAQIAGELDVFYSKEGLVKSLADTAEKYIRADLHEALQAKADALAEDLDTIANYRKACHAHDDDMGHVRRDFDVEDFKLCEAMARTALSQYRGEG